MWSPPGSWPREARRNRPAMWSGALPCLIVADLKDGWNGAVCPGWELRHGYMYLAHVPIRRDFGLRSCDPYPSEAPSPFIGGHAVIPINKGLRLIQQSTIPPWVLTHMIFNINTYPLQYWVHTSSKKEPQNSAP